MTDQAIVIFGATGDLALRMLYPSLYFLDLDELLPPRLKIIGCSRSELGRRGFAAKIREAVRIRTPDGEIDEAAWKRFAARLGYVAGDASAPEIYAQLKDRLNGRTECVFYLSTSPSLYDPIVINLAAAGLAGGRSRVVVEKPIGHDLASCREINDTLAKAFSEDRIFRIDHYLGKETVQNLLALRFANTLFEPLWNNALHRPRADHRRPRRWAWRAAGPTTTTTAPCATWCRTTCCSCSAWWPWSRRRASTPNSVRNEKVKVLRSLRPITGREVERTHRARPVHAPASPTAAPVAGLPRGGRRQAPATPRPSSPCRPTSTTGAGPGVPFYLRTGKRLPSAHSQIVIQFRDVPHSIFAGDRPCSPTG